ncbi:MAG: aminoglycoside phosphotransferase [Actinobacteria bacterium]|nr:aminoglycoside phosphotransferase [Actinomycetota bacterium]
MAEIHTGATITPSKVELLTSWMGHQRWYAAKGATPQLRRLRSFRFEDPAGEVGVEVMVLADDAGPSPVVYQVPVSYRGAPLAGAETALIGTFEHSVLGTRWVYDGCHDPVFADRLVAVLRGHDQVHSSTVDGALDDTVTGHAHPTWPAEPLVRSARVLSGEQSNTSIIIDASDGDGHAMPLMVKVFRTLQPGHNPDVDLQSALYEAGCHRVPSTMGHLRAHWPTAAGEPATEGEHAAYDLAFAQEFLPGVEDAWRVASRAVEEGHDFSEAARALGAATAEVHGTLAQTLGTTPVTHETGTAIVEEMRARFSAAVGEVEQLARFADLVDGVLERAAAAPWPPMQRIHGDYHLGQVLHSAARGWILLDFEGEPMRPLAERALPDQWIRDVAGMLRSLDYCGGAWELDNPGSARPWVTAAQTAFLQGYAVASGVDPLTHEALLTAFELDKAMYEVVYEARNRPDWVSIPLAAIDRLTAGHDAQKESP